MNAKDYFKLTIKVRGKDVRYFTTRDNQVKAEAINVEKKQDEVIIDAALRDDEIYQCVKEDYPELIVRIENRRQGNLF